MGGARGVLRGLRTCLHLLLVVLSFHVIRSAIQTETTELHCRPIDRVIARHDHGLLLIEDAALEA